MNLKCLNSGSIGNCYLLEADNEILILDCGIPIKDIKIELDFDLSKVVGCVVTHAHKDHSKSVNDFKKMGIPVWQPYLEEKKILKHGFGNFTVQSFDVPHDDTPCVGYLIGFPNGEKLLYATDFEYIPYSFKNVHIDYALIEANYQKEYIERLAIKTNHVLKGHAELRTTVGIIKDNIDSLKTIVLCHLSTGNANHKEMVAEVQKVAKCPVYVAEKGLEIELKDSSCPF